MQKCNGVLIGRRSTATNIKYCYMDTTIEIQLNNTCSTNTLNFSKAICIVSVQEYVFYVFFSIKNTTFYVILNDATKVVKI